MFSFFRRRRLKQEAIRLGGEWVAGFNAALDHKMAAFPELADSYLASLRDGLEFMAEEPGGTRAEAEEYLIAMAQDYDAEAPAIRSAVHDFMEPLYAEAEGLGWREDCTAAVDRRLDEFRFNLVARGTIIWGEFCEREGYPPHPSTGEQSAGL